MATKKQNDEQATPATPVDENQTASGRENSGQEERMARRKRRKYGKRPLFRKKMWRQRLRKRQSRPRGNPPTGKTWWTWPCWLTATASRPGWRPPCAA